MEQAKERVALLDELRGGAIVLMFICHLTFDVMLLSGAPGYYDSWVARYLAPFTGGVFTLIAGICSCYSRGTVRRGLILLAAALLITLVTALMAPHLKITFGVLHMLGCCMVLAGLAAPGLNRLKPAVGAALSLLLFISVANVALGYLGIGDWRLALPAVLYQTPGLFPLGFRTADFFSADYYPLLPWFFLFLAGRFAGMSLRRTALPASVYQKRCLILSRMGQHSLPIYLLHQPVFMALLWLGATLLKAAR